ncbi:MAG: DUF2189 domain-containing protein [Rhodopseudomonas palustris]|nr:MAG: DUF2189 domain-containing protein [Rhodopseudomonas palustris]
MADHGPTPEQSPASARTPFTADAAAPGAPTVPVPVVQRLDVADLFDALRRGWADFKAVPSHAILLCVIYPLLGLALARIVMGYAVLPMLFPLASGFALIGPFAALGLYELSRRRELGQTASAWDAAAVLRSPSLGAMLTLGALLLVIFIGWLASAQAIYVATFGNAPAAALPDFATQVLTTRAGWQLIVIGCSVGFLFAAASLCLSLVSFPLLLDRQIGVVEAISTSLRVTARNPLTIAAWGAIVAALLILGSLPLFLGLTVVLPLLGHATWHLYRTAVVPNPSPPRIRPSRRARRSAADFPSVLLDRKRGD